MLRFQGGTVDAHGLPEGCSGQSSSGVYVAAMRSEPLALGVLPPDVLRRLEQEAIDAIAEAFAAGTTEEPHIKYMRDVQRQCREELARRRLP